MSKWVILGVGSRGDLEPALTLARAAARVGETVVVVGLREYQILAEGETSFAYVPVDVDLPRVRQDRGLALSWAYRHSTSSAAIAAGALELWARSAARAVADAMLETVEPGDLVVAGVMTLDAALLMRQVRDCRVAVVFHAPSFPTAHGPSLLNAPLPAGVSCVNLAYGHVARRVAMRWGIPIGAAVRERLSLPSVEPRQLARAASTIVNLAPLNRLLVPKADDWPSYVRRTDSWLPNVADLDQNHVPEAVKLFLDRADAPTILVDFGSLVDARDAALVAEAAKVAKSHVLMGYRGPEISVESRVCLFSSVSHAQLMPLVSAFVHHGGAGSSLMALQAGVPSVAIPRFFDQPYYACRLDRLSLGPKSIPRRHLTVERLAELFMLLNDVGSTALFSSNALRTKAALSLLGTDEAIRCLQSVAM